MREQRLAQAKLTHSLNQSINQSMVQALVDCKETSVTLQTYSTLLAAGKWVADVPFCCAAGFQFHGSCCHPPFLTTL